MTDPAVHGRLEALHHRLTQPTPAPLAGQQTIDLEHHPPDSDDEPGPPTPSSRP